MKKRMIATLLITLLTVTMIGGCGKNCAAELTNTNLAKEEFGMEFFVGIKDYIAVATRNIEGAASEIVTHITSLDVTAPVIVTEDITIKINDDINLMDGVTSTDDVDGDLTDKVAVTGTVDTTKEGTYKVTYNVADAAGNEAVAERIVTVEKKATPKKGKTTTGGTTTSKGGATTGITDTTTGGNSGTVVTPTNPTPAPAPASTPTIPTTPAPSDPPMVCPNPPTEEEIKITNDALKDPKLLETPWEDIIIV